jgi:hypothetical protein
MRRLGSNNASQLGITAKLTLVAFTSLILRNYTILKCNAKMRSDVEMKTIGVIARKILTIAL